MQSWFHVSKADDPAVTVLRPFVNSILIGYKSHTIIGLEEVNGFLPLNHTIGHTGPLNKNLMLQNEPLGFFKLYF